MCKLADAPCSNPSAVDTAVEASSPGCVASPPSLAASTSRSGAAADSGSGHCVERMLITLAREVPALSCFCLKLCERTLRSRAVVAPANARLTASCAVAPRLPLAWAIQAFESEIRCPCCIPPLTCCANLCALGVCGIVIISTKQRITAQTCTAHNRFTATEESDSPVALMWCVPPALCSV